MNGVLEIVRGDDDRGAGLEFPAEVVASSVGATWLVGRVLIDEADPFAVVVLGGTDQCELVECVFGGMDEDDGRAAMASRIMLR